MVRAFIPVLIILSLSGCAATLQALPVTVGEQDGKAVWMIHGYTSPGETTRADAQKYADHYSAKHCRNGRSKVLSLETEPTWNAFSNFLRWNARFICT